MPRSEFASGRLQLPLNASNITVSSGGTTTSTNIRYLYIQGENTLGKNLPSAVVGPFNVPPGNKLTITLPPEVRLAGEAWVAIVVSASTTNIPTTFTQIARAQFPIDLPATVVLDSDDDFALSRIVSNPASLPANPINGQLRGVANLSYVYEFSSVSGIEADGIFVLPSANGRWHRRSVLFESYIGDVESTGGCGQEIEDIADSSLIRTPSYACDRSIGAPIRYWIRNDTGSPITAGKRVGLLVRFNGETRSQLFDGLLKLTFRGHANTVNGSLRTIYTSNGQELSGLNEEVLFSANKSNLILQDALLPNEAYVFDCAPCFDLTDLGNQVPEVTISIYPFFYPQSGSYSEAGRITGNLIYGEDNQRRIVPSVGLTARALSGSGIVDSFNFFKVAETLVTGFALNTANQVIAIDHDGNVKIRNGALPSTEAIRAKVGSIDGTGVPTAWSGAVALSSTQQLRVVVTNSNIVRGTYPDAIAGNNRGTLNATKAVIYVQPLAGGNIQAFDAAIVPSSPTSTLVFGATAGRVLTILPTVANNFGLFVPASFTATPVTATNSVFTAQNYRIAIAYGYENTITTITHSSTDGCIYETTTTFDKVLDSTKYWAPAVADIDALRAIPLAQIANYQSRWVAEREESAHFKAESYAVDDGLNVVKPNELSPDQPGRWLVDYAYVDVGSDQTVIGTKTLTKPLISRADRTSTSIFAYHEQEQESLFALLVSGFMKWGAGGVSAPDTNFYRSAIATLKTDGKMVVGQGVTAQSLRVISPITDTDLVLSSNAFDGSPAAFALKTTGRMEWQSDTDLFRAGTQILKTTSTFAAKRLVTQGDLGLPALGSSSVGTKLLLHLAAGASSADYAIGVGTNMSWYSIPQAASTFYHAFYAGATELLRMRGDGNVGVGTTSPGAKLQVSGGVAIAANTAEAINPGAGNLRVDGSIRATEYYGKWAGAPISLASGGTGIGATTFTFAAPDDTNGVFYYIGTNYGSEDWTNPYLSERLDLRVRGGENNDIARLVDRDPDQYGQEFYVADGNPSVITCDLIDYRIVLDGYFIRSGRNGGRPRGIRVLGSNDNTNWTELDRQPDLLSLFVSYPNSGQLWTYVNAADTTNDYRYIQFEVIPYTPIDSGSDVLQMGEIELYGKVIAASQPRQLLVGDGNAYTSRTLVAGKNTLIDYEHATLSISSTLGVETAFEYEFSGDANGIFYHLGTNYGNAPNWANPHEIGTLTITSSSLTRGALSDLVRRQNSFVQTNSEIPAWFIFDVGTDYHVVVNGYSIKSSSELTQGTFGGGGGDLNPTQWRLRGSNNKIDWTDLDVQSNMNRLRGAVNKSFYADIYPENTGYRYIQFYQDRARTYFNAANYLTLGQLEIYGKLRKLAGVGAIPIARGNGSDYSLTTITEGQGIAIENKAGNIVINSNIRVKDAKDFVYVTGGDENGVFYYIGTSYGTENWANPFTAGRLIITSDPAFPANTGSTIEAIVGRIGNNFSIRGNPDVSIVFDLGIAYKLALSGYAFRSSGLAGYPRNWRIYGSNNNISWNIINVQNDNIGLNSADQWLYIGNLNSLDSYRYFKLFFIGNLVLAGIELYGRLKNTNPPRQGQLLIGDGTQYIRSTLTAGIGISIANRPGEVEINAIPTSRYSELIVEDNPYIYYRMDDIDGDRATDSSNNGRHGTYSGDYSLALPSSLKVNEFPDSSNAVRFGPTNARVIPRHPVFTPNPVTTVVLRFRVQPSEVGSIGFAMIDGNAQFYTVTCLIGMNGGKLTFSPGRDGLITPLAYNDGQWHSAAFRIISNDSFKSGVMSIIVDGQEVSTGTPYGFGFSFGNGQFHVGRTPDLYGAKDLDEVAFFLGKGISNERLLEYHTTAANANVLTDAEKIHGRRIDSSFLLKNEGYVWDGNQLQFSPKPLVILPKSDYSALILADSPFIYYECDERSGTIALDSSGNNRHGTYVQTVQGGNGVVLAQESSLLVDNQPDSGKSIILDQTFLGRVQPSYPPFTIPQVFTIILRYKTTIVSQREMGLVSFTDRLVGYANRTGNVHMFHGALDFSLINGGFVSTDSRFSNYSDGKWHSAVFRLDSSGTSMWIDGQIVAANNVTAHTPFDGYFHVGHDGIYTFTGSLDHVALFHSSISDARLREYHTAITKTTAVVDRQQKFKYNQATTTHLLTDAPTIVVDARLANKFRVTLGGNRVLANPTNLQDATYMFHLVQDGSGGRTVSFGNKFKFIQGILPILSTSPNSRDLLTCESDGVNLYCTLLKDLR